MLRKLAKQDKDMQLVEKINDGLKKELLSEVQASVQSRSGQTMSSGQLSEMEIVLRACVRLCEDMEKPMREVRSVLQRSARPCEPECTLPALWQEQDAAFQREGVLSKTSSEEGTARVRASTGKAGACTEQPGCKVNRWPEDRHLQDQLDRLKLDVEVMVQKLRRQDEDGKFVAKENLRLKQELLEQLSEQKPKSKVGSFPALNGAGSRMETWEFAD